MRGRLAGKLLLSVGLLSTLVACSLISPRPIEVERSQVTPVVSLQEAATPSERAAFVEKMLSGAAPSPILDARYVELQLGDGMLGPSDYQFFARVTVAPEDIAAWQERLQAESTVAAALLPPAPPMVEWWLEAEESGDYLFYAAQPWFGHDGFIALNQAGEGIIYFFTMTR